MLVEKYKTPREIPNDDFYAYISAQEFKDQLGAQLELGLDKYLAMMSPSPIFIEARRRAQQDLFFLARYFCWDTNPESAGKTFKDNLIIERVHGRMCDMYVQKDNSKTVAEQDPICKERLILYPRGTMKSSIDICDAVQWVINFPDIRLLYLTAADDLAVSFVDETKGRFVERPGDPTLMQLFFPEFCTTEKALAAETAFQFTSPQWKRQLVRRREPTIMASSITSTLSGFHFEVVKADDVISNRNTENEEQCKKVTKKIQVSVRKMLRPFGYLDSIGTRYADEDYYGEVIEKNVGDLIRTGGPNWEIVENLATGLKILVGRAWEIKPEIQAKLDKAEIKQEDLAEDSYTLLFPEALTYSFLHQEQRRDEISFEGQYNNNPRPASRTPFPRTLLLKQTVCFEEMPFRGPTSITWDFAFSKKKGRDYSTACCAMWNDKAECFITDLIRGRFHHNDLAKAVVDMAMKWRPFVIGIEEAGGSRFLEPTIMAEAIKTNQPQVIAVCSKIDWIIPDNQKDAKKMRMAALHPWLMNNRMKFANYLPYLDTLYTEFERCLTSHHHDDIPDVISRQVKYAPTMGTLATDNAFRSISRVDDAWHLLFEEGYADNYGVMSPFGGMILSHDPESGQLRWNALPVHNPIVNPLPDETGPRPESPPSLDPILGTGIYG